ELAGEIEPKLRLPRAPGDAQPIALALRCPAAIIVDHERGSTWLVAEDDRPELLDSLAADVSAERAAVSPLRTHASIDEDPPPRFLEGVGRIHEYLRAGDVFQVNLSREWRLQYAT